MTDVKKYKQFQKNWDDFIKNEKFLIETPIYQYSGDPLNPEDATSKWDPETVKKYAVTGSSEVGHGSEMPEVEKEAKKQVDTIMNVAVGAAGAAIIWKIGPLAVYRLLRRLGPLFVRAFRARGMAGITSMLGQTAVRSALLAAGVKIALLSAVGYGLYKYYKDKVGKVAVATSNPLGPYRETTSVTSWKLVSDVRRCSWCKSNPGREHPSLKDSKEAWAAVEGGEMPPKIKKTWEDIQKNGPFCNDILKTNACKNLKPGAESNTGIKVSDSELKGEVTQTPEGIQHNLTGEKKEMAESFMDFMRKLGITNKYILAGALATQAKESGFKNVAERGKYPVKSLLPNSPGLKTVGRRVRRVFQHQLGRDPLESELKQLSSENPKGMIALFNIAYGYDPKGVKGYNTYQLDSAIPHSVKVVTKTGVINPDLFNPELAGYKYRGRGPIQTTFKETYYKTAKAFGGESFAKEVVDDPDIILQSTAMAARMSAGFAKMNLNKAKRNITKYGGVANPQTLEEGILFMCYLAGGGGAKIPARWYDYAIKAATNAANKHIRIVENPVG